jgi:hypothetical protein
VTVGSRTAEGQWWPRAFFLQPLPFHDRMQAWNGCARFTLQEPLRGRQMPTWQGSDSQTTGSPPVQAPAWHVSVCVQALSSSHDVPSGFGGFTHWPVDGSHTLASWHASPGVLHVIALPATQTPAWQLSLNVHRLPSSSHDVPSGFAGFEHMPVVGLQTPAAWQESDAAQTMGFPPTHAPA